MNALSQTSPELPVLLEHTDTAHMAAGGELAHWHDAIELVCVTRGRLRCQTNQETFLLGKGDLCFVNRRQVHHLMAADNAPGDCMTLVIDTGVLAQSPRVFEACVRPVLDEAAFSHVLLRASQGRAERIRGYLKDVEVLLRERPHAFELEVMARCFQIFRQLSCVLAERDAAPEPVDSNLETLRRMMAYVREHFAENVQLEDIAAAGSVSKSTCSRLFARYTSRSPVAHLIDYRLEVAAARLRQTDDSVAAIAHACGFSQQSYFNRVFLRAYGVTPGAYRREGAVGRG